MMTQLIHGGDNLQSQISLNQSFYPSKTESGQGFIIGSVLRIVGRLGLFLIKGKDGSGTSFPLYSCLAHKCDGRNYSSYNTTMRKKLLKAPQLLPIFRLRVM